MTRTEPESSPHLTFLGRWVIFVVGVAGIVNEAFVRGASPRIPLLVLYAGMLGLPGFVSLDNLVGRGKRSNEELPPAGPTTSTSKEGP